MGRRLTIRSATVKIDGEERTYYQGDDVPEDVASELQPSAFAATRNTDAASTEIAPHQAGDGIGVAPHQAGDAGYDAQSKPDLEAEAKRRGIYESIQGTGADANVVKDDLVAALQADDAG